MVVKYNTHWALVGQYVHHSLIFRLYPASWVLFTFSHALTLRPISVLLSYLYAGLSNYLFPLGVSTKILYAIILLLLDPDCCFSLLLYFMTGIKSSKNAWMPLRISTFTYKACIPIKRRHQQYFYKIMGIIYYPESAQLCNSTVFWGMARVRYCPIIY